MEKTDEKARLPRAVLHDTADLKARFGSHWNGLARATAVHEALEDKRDEDYGKFATAEGAIAYVRERRASNLATMGRHSERRLSALHNRIILFKARWGLGKDPSAVLEAEKAEREKVAAWHRGVGDWMPEVVPLPPTMRGPVMLEVGQEVWLVSASWVLSSDVRVQKLRIEDVRIYPFHDPELGYDISFRYTASPVDGEKGRTLDFSYDHAEIGDTEVKASLMENWGYLRREPAARKVAEVATRLRKVAEDAERAMESLA